MKTKKLKIFMLFVFMLTGITIVFVTKHIYNSRTKNSLININKLSDKFMDKYFEEIKTVDETDEENMLIVVSKNKLVNDFGATKIIEGPNNQYFIIFDSEIDKEKAFEKLNNNKDIISVDKNNLYTFTEFENNSSYNSWGVEKSGFDYINNILPKEVEEVKVAIVDTGCDMELFNEYYSGKIVESYNFYNYTGYDEFDNVIPDTEFMYDNYGHGTHIAGTIAESTPSNVKIIPYKVSDGSNLSDFDLINAINHIAYNKTADVINMSFGSDFYNYAIDMAIESARKENIISVAAAGNESVSTSNYPALNENTISIAAVDSDLNLAEFSNYGDGLDFSAPGVDILSINGTMSGTSMATPHAVSAVAILKSLDKELSLEDTKDLLKMHALDLGPKGYDKHFGDGFINFSSVELCDESENYTCDDYGIFKQLLSTEIAVNKVIFTDYNYGSLNNILASELTVIKEDGSSVTKPLYEFDDIKILNYDPFSSVEQVIYIEYKDLDTSIKVTNPTNYELGWEYTYDYNTPDSIILTKYKSNNKGINKLYFPSMLNGKKVVALADGTDLSNIFDKSNDIKYYEEVYLPDSITKIGGYAFKGFENLYNIFSETEVLFVSYGAFYDLKNLLSINTNIYLNEYSHSAFYNNESLEYIELSEDTKIIPSTAFSGCRYLKTIELPENLENIDSFAFAYSGIEEINIPSSVKKIDDYALYNTLIESIYIPELVEYIGENVFNSFNLQNIEVSSNNIKYDSRDNSNAIIETKSNTLLYGSSNTIIPNTIVKIASNAFEGSSINKLVIPESVVEIGTDAFLYADLLEEIYLPRSIKSLPQGLFGKNSGFYSRYLQTVLFVYDDSYSYEYAINNNLAYKILEKEYEFDYEFISLGFRFRDFDPENLNHGDIIDKSKIDVIAYYNNFEIEKVLEKDDFWFEYESGVDHLVYGDTYVILHLNLHNGIKNLKDKFPVVVNKITPEFEVPTGLTGRLGQKLSEIALPENFSWMDGNIMLTKLGEQTFKAKYEIDENYQIVENIDVVINVNGKSIIEPKISIDNKVYDGTTELDIKSIKIENLDSDEYIITKVESSETNVGVRNATIKLKLSDDKFKYFAFDGEVQEKEFNVEFNIIPKKINVQYKSSGKTVKYDGKYHGIDIDIESPQNVNIKYMDENSNYILDEMPKFKEVGEYIIKFRIYIDENHTDIYGEETLKILNDSIINNTQDCETIYDGKYHSLNIDIDIDSYEVKYSLDNKNYNLNTSPKFIGVGEYTVYYKIISKNYDDYYGSNKVKIYGIKSFDNTIVIRDNILILKNNSFSNLKSKLSIYAKSILYNHLGNNGLLIDKDNLITGDILEIILNNSTKYNYNLSILGDVNADGKISSADYVKIRKHIMQSEMINNNIYFYSADINNDNKISSSDYVKIRKYIMNGESL